ncbi:imidazolonepropionase-like amidohydrolase [Thermocatellispora tengchongensis]|uniref:Imidazolonepropionase-like amidohydrolase n=1 Tax=Thermocatellispora tengchongensis TaxID=1073253 RepID=A0A840PH94_9ACTN|nr:amidohydrolase family protein [Thermocatellispora tengchongensis]MBB5136900.1 imidazolonepropionase-like amidohydrolase [Thermocatellispora tengchongensis]
MTGGILLRNCTIVDAVRPAPVPDAAVWIVGDRIRDAGPRAEVTARVAADAPPYREIDLGGACLAPGLINMHTHLSLSLPGAMGERIKRMTSHEIALYMADGARRTLLGGVTTIRCVGEKEHADFALRGSIEAGLVPGPRIFTAGRGLTCTGGHGHASSGALECDGPTGFRKGVRAQVKAGADLIKVMISGGISGRHERIDTRQVTRRELTAVIETAHEWGRKVTAHAGPAPVTAEAVELGVDCVEHGYELTAPLAALMAERGCSYVPTLVVTRCKEFFDELGVPEWMQRRSLDAGERHMDSFRLALEAGVDVMLGSDMPPFWRFEGTTAAIRELEHMSAGGLGPRRALAAATIGPARWLGAQDDLGSIEPGKYADLVALDGDPAADTSALRSIWLVLKGGEVVRDDRGATLPALTGSAG